MPRTASPPRLTRAQKSQRTRQALLDAAMNVVGELGHGEASIVNITRAADVALGTFYMHFGSKQELLNELLPWAGRNAHEHMNAAVAGARNYAEYEARNFDALVDFQRRNPFYFRLLSESEVATPESYQRHLERSIARYRGALEQAHARGELPQYDAEDLEVLATMLVSIKLLLFMRHSGRDGVAPRIRRVYLTFVLQGLLGERAAAALAGTLEPPARPRRKTTSGTKPKR